MQTLDWIIVGIYLALLGAVGIIATARVKTSGEYFLGGRGFGKLLMVAQSFGVSTHAEMPVSLAGAVYSLGISAIWFQWKNLFAMPFYWIMAPVFRRVRRTTSAEVMADRYGAGMGMLYVVFAFVFFIIALASVLKGGAKILSEVLGGGATVNHVVVGLAVIFVLYSFTGGLVASTWSNFLQGLLIIIFSVMLIPLGWKLVGGFGGMRQTLPGNFFSMATPKLVGPWFIAMLTLNGLIGIMAQPHMIAAVGTGKDEYACRVGFLHGTFMKRLCTIGWAIVGLMVAGMVGRGLFGTSRLSDPEEAFGFACRHLLTTGFRGLLFAGVMGASLACCSALMIDSGALFTEGIYRRHISSGRSDRHYLWMGRLSGFAAVLLAVAYAVFLIQKVLYSFLLMETIATYMGISMVGGIIWRRANRWGAAGSVVVALTTNFSLYHLRHQRLDAWDPNIFLASFLAGVATLVLLSLATAPEQGSEVDTFFTNLESPSDLDGAVAENSDAARNEERPNPNVWAAERGRQLLFVNLLHLHRGAQGFGCFRAYRDDLKGLAIGAGLCAGLVFTMWAIMQM